MKDKIRFDLTDNERTTIIKSLNLLRNYLATQERSTASVDEILLKMSDSHRFELDTFDARIVINSLDIMRTKLKHENQPRGELNDILLKVIDKVDNNDKKKVLILRKHTRDNGRRF